MEKLFKDSEVFQKDRPTKATDLQIKEMYSNLADEVIERGWNNENKKCIISDLKELDFSDEVFEKAKTMDDFGGYDMTIDFMEWLDSLYWKKRSLIENNVKDWVKAHNIKPTHERGTKLFVEERLNRLAPSGIHLYITGYSLDAGCYLVSTDKNRNGGTVIAYEIIHEKCKPVNQ